MGEVEDVPDAQALEAAKTQSLFRSINERIEDLNDAFATVIPTGEWVCECYDLTCIEQILMPLEDYEQIRAHPNRFFVVPGHDDPVVERVVWTGDGFLVVEKVGVGADFAVRDDPRRAARDSVGGGRRTAIETQSRELEGG